MSWWQRLFHQPPDPEVRVIKSDLRKEEARHVRELDRIHDALADLERTRRVADGELQERVAEGELQQ